MKKPAIVVKEESNGTVKKIYKGDSYIGVVKMVAKNCWTYTNCIGHGGQAKTEHEAFAMLGFKLSKNADGG